MDIGNFQVIRTKDSTKKSIVSQ